ncbi:PP2C family protein-serine/threonine phosphatase [Streptomyces sp. VRA16 Mangrove soil]|uniref:PP2C family protein-serine/threonine phosphatase n=1 Tax=Streptomyces sp. VRA16 Mangrove soil TaxID=2817434 RepID=UPI001A9E6AE8|nr:PP2C family protein-serine/threonine phosphatase [Streptomyces sp. VRA16 Mangrove soil]MBO1332918.1 serine/threonine-protein phosphatase [Streptomyces sp. VRA16 Mangrove soil]
MTARSTSRTTLPDQVGTLRVSARRLIAGAERGGTGGDLHDVLDTAFGTRLLIGDAMGKGPEGARSAAAVLHAWRQLAVHERSLEVLAVRLHSLVTHSADPDRFVTAALLTFAPDGSAEMVCCGHPPPVLIRAGGAVSAVVPAPAPPLGLLDLGQGWCATQPVPASSWDRMLLHTDGVSEARDGDGDFYPLCERAAELAVRPLTTFTAALAADLVHHARGCLQDDATLLAVEHAPP